MTVREPTARNLATDTDLDLRIHTLTRWAALLRAGTLTEPDTFWEIRPLSSLYLPRPCPRSAELPPVQLIPSGDFVLQRVVATERISVEADAGGAHRCGLCARPHGSGLGLRVRTEPSWQVTSSATAATLFVRRHLGERR